MPEQTQLPAASEAGPVMDVLPSSERCFGRYSLVYKLASGGMANLYLARFTGPDGFEKLVAIKRIHEHLADNQEFIRMFIDEARLVARIAHPSVAQTLELGVVGRSYFIAMEYVEGETLNAILQKIKPEYPVSARIVANAAAGLHAAHELRNADGGALHVVHRDVSPSNILVSYEGAVKVVDFGVARARGKLSQTAVGALKGKLAYMSPEQTTLGQIDRRSDIFALGIILYEMTTWRRLFRAPNESDTIAKVAKCEIPPPSSFLDDYPPQLETIVMKALKKNPDERYQTAGELSRDLEQFIVTWGTAVPPEAVGEVMKTLFAKRIEEKKQMLRNCTNLPEVQALDISHTGTGSSISLRLGASAIFTPQHRWKTLAIALVALLALGGAAFAGYHLFGKRGKSTGGQAKIEPPPKVDSAPREIKISIRVTPPEATIEIGGVAVKNPYEVRHKAGTGTEKVVISAPSFRSQSFDLPLAEGGSWVVALEPQPQTPATKPVAKVGPVPKVKGGKRKDPKKTKTDDDLFPSPYKIKSKKK
jgi:eukaryotic-like serine/threonine-protein kinase